MIGKEKPSEFEVNVLETIVKNSIESISYKHPEEELGEVVKGKSLDEIRDVLRKLSSVVEYIPKRVLWIDKSSYDVNLAQAQDLYDSYQEA